MRRGMGCALALTAWVAACGDGGGGSAPGDAGATPPDSRVPDSAVPDSAVADAAVADAMADGGPVDGGSDAGPPRRWVVRVAPAAPDAVRWAAEDVARYLGEMGLEATLEAGRGEVACAPGVGVAALVGDGLGEAALASEEPTDQTWRIEEVRCGDGALVTLAGGGLLGRQYAPYEWLHHLGVRFFHPEQEYVPAAPRWPDAPLVREHTPAFRFRSVSLHLSHPLELGDPLRLRDPRYFEEVRRYIDWSVKNLASYGLSGGGDGALRTRGLDRGFPRGTGFALFNQQQGSSGIVDPDDPRPPEAQIGAAIDARMGDDPLARPEIFQFTFNPTEFTEMDDRLVVEYLTLIADHMAERYPETVLLTINHGTAGEPTPHYGVRYYDLPRFAPPNLGVSVHTLMFYDLFRPAPVYGNEDFRFLFDFMVDEYRTRRLWYFPESAWWLTFDIAVPLYLPITIEARHRDIQGIAFMLDGKLDGHRTFGSGHEWGYWQNEYCSLRMAADLDYGWRDCLADITWPMGEAAGEVRTVLERLVEIQERDFIYDRELLAYLVGTDPETELAASVGVVFHPLPPAPREILRWDEAALDAWERRVAPALERMDADYDALLARLAAAAERVPADGRPWFDEIRDGVEITGLRARHARQVYGALVTFRRAQLRFDPALEAEARALLEAARATTEAAITVVRRREAAYRYRPLERAIAGGPDGTEDENWTIYGYRYLNRAHHGYYYTRIDDLAAAAMVGGGDAVGIPDVVVGPGEPLRVEAADPALAEVAVDFGDGTTADALPAEHVYAAPGVFTLRVTGRRGDDPFELAADVARTVEPPVATGFTGRVTEPDGVALIEPVLPGLVLGALDDGAPGRLALGFDTGGAGRVAPDRWIALPAAPDGGLATAPARVVVPVVNRAAGEILTRLVVEAAVVRHDPAAGALTLSGNLSTQAVIDAVVAVGGFEPAGARALVASTLGYTPDTLPETVAFAVAYEAARE